MTKSIDELLSNIPKILTIAMLALVLAHIGFLILYLGFDRDYVFGLSGFFTLDAENTAPAWFSTILLSSSALLLYIIYRATYDTKPDKFWVVLSFIFLFISLDEMNSLHERLGYVLHEYYSLSGYFLFSWVIAGLLVTLVIGLMSIPFLRRLPSKTAIHFIIAGCVYIIGAVGMEMIASNEISSILESHAEGVMISAEESAAILKNSIFYNVVMTIEETMEMAGIIFFNYSLVRYLKFVVNNNEEY